MSGTNPFSDNDQRTAKGEYLPPKFEEGQENSHDLMDSKDERTIANRLGHAEQKGKEERQREISGENTDPTQPARDHGNEPSRGAKVDKELQREEQEYLERKGWV